VKTSLRSSIYKRYSSYKESVLVFLIFYYVITKARFQKLNSLKINYKFKSKNGKPDYDDLNYWAAHPFKNDPSDLVSLELKKEKKDSLADVFFIYPTTYTDPTLSMGWNAAIDDEPLNRRTDDTAILYQASVFNKYCRIFSPRYRQANLSAFHTANKIKAGEALQIAYSDIKIAFKYYLENLNNGRPIIIASHSQGTWHAGELLKEFFDGKPLQKKLVCAYLIGAPVFTSYFSQLKPCQYSSDFGGFVSWRTFSEGYVPQSIKKETEQAYVTNPLTWMMDDKLAMANLNKGGMLHDFDKIVPGLVHAQIHGNILWVNDPKFIGNFSLSLKDYHIADYNLFYENIRENVGERINAFLTTGTTRILITETSNQQSELKQKK
jgi:hypothetical protein